jgi:hypothetical protein
MLEKEEQPNFPITSRVGSKCKILAVNVRDLHDDGIDPL